MTDDQTPLPDDEILRCGLCGREARIVRLRPGGIEHVIGRLRHPVILGPAPRPASEDHASASGRRLRGGPGRHRGIPAAGGRHPYRLGPACPSGLPSAGVGEADPLGAL